MQFIQTILLASLQKQKTSLLTTETQTENLRPITPLPTFSPGVPNVNKPNKYAHHRHNHTKGCKVCTQKNLEEALQHLQTVASGPK